MASNRQTTMAKLAREQAVKERRLRKQERKAERKAAAGQSPEAEAENSPSDVSVDETSAAPA